MPETQDGIKEYQYKPLFEDCPDMFPIYRNLLSLYKNAPDFCPTLCIMEDLPEGKSYMKYSDILLLKQGTIIDASMTVNNIDYLPFTSFADFSFDIYKMATIACEKMKIKCPQILPGSEMGQLRGVIYQNKSNLSKLLVLRPGMHYKDTLEVLFHELRHAWQHETNHSFYFSNYRFLDTEIDLQEYMRQPAELDAEAFSVRMMVDMDMEKYPVMRSISNEINRIIEKKAKKMRF